MIWLSVNVPSQTLAVFSGDKRIKKYTVSTAAKGVGEVINSEQTPRGWHCIRAKIGRNCVHGAVFVERRPTGEIYSPELRMQYPERDWILTRILWLSGLEKGKNRLGQVDTMRRYIYIHGMPDDVLPGKPGSRGCVRMRNQDIVELFDIVTPGTRLLINAETQQTEVE